MAQQQQQYPPPPPGYPPLSPGYPPQQPWYPPQQYAQQPVMIQQGGYAPQQYQSSGKVKGALILAIVVAVVTTCAGIFWAAAISPWGGGLCLFFWWLAHGFGLAGAGCKNACLMMTYAVFGFIYAFISLCLGCWYAYWAHEASEALDNHVFGYRGEELSKKGLTTMQMSCYNVYGTTDVIACLLKDKYYGIALSALLFIITILFATSAGLFIRARSEVNTLQFQAAYGGQPPVYSGSQTQRTA